MNSLASIILPSAAVMRGNSERLLKDISADKFARKAEGARGVIELNHPAFNYGHLAIYPERLMRALGRDVTAVQVPETWPDLFKGGAVCRDDPQGEIYPSMAEITGKYFSAYDELTRLLPDLSDETLRAGHPDEGARKKFGSIGSMINFLLTTHIAMHMGQVSAWRRCMGMPAV